MYIVVVNGEEQYSIWLANKAVPPGWREVGKKGRKAECLAYITTMWTDPLPRSLRIDMGLTLEGNQH